MAGQLDALPRRVLFRRRSLGRNLGIHS
jgi:hypothetical protein